MCAAEAKDSRRAIGAAQQWTIQTDTELNGHNADNRKIGIDVCNPLSSNYTYDTAGGGCAVFLLVGAPRHHIILLYVGRMKKNGNSV